MALQAIPLLLAGGAGVYVYSKAKKRKKRRAGAECPPENTITLGEVQTVAHRAKQKYGEAASPFKEASFYIGELLPPGCNKNSKDSRVKMQFGTKEDPVDYDVSVPDLYMLALVNGINRRGGADKLNQKQADKFWADGLDWYKRATGKNFDVASLGLQEFADALAAAMMEAFGGKAKKKKKEPEEECPAQIRFALTEGVRQEILGIYQQAIAMGEKNAFAIADEVFVRAVPEGCTKRDYETTIELTFEAYGDDELGKVVMNLALFYASIVLDVLEELVKAGLVSEMEAQRTFGQIVGDYKRLTGKDLDLPSVSS